MTQLENGIVSGAKQATVQAHGFIQNHSFDIGTSNSHIVQDY